MSTDAPPPGSSTKLANVPRPDRDREELRKFVEKCLDGEASTRKGEEPEADGWRTRVRLDGGVTCTSTNHYVIKEKIGEGGMGVVYRAFDEKLHRDVAIKVLFQSDDDSLERFIREQEITACLDHPNFVRVLAIGYLTLRDRSLPFYAMPLIRGRTLERLILRRLFQDSEGLRLRREFTQATLLRMLGQLCLTLQSAHDKRIIHRDLKPSNILIGPYGDVYVTDLGLAKFLSPDASETTVFDLHVLEQWSRIQGSGTQETIMGTPFYMAPEQGLTPRSVDHRADIFGLGAVLYFLLAGCKPQYRQLWLDPETLETRKAELLGDLGRRAGPAFSVEAVLYQQPDDLDPDLRSMVVEYRDLVEALQGSDYHRFRLTMKSCSIIPPSEVLGEFYGNREGEEAAGNEPLDPLLEAICMKALAKRPEERYASCRLFWEALHGYVEGKELAKLGSA
ncbi:MAG TPA: serine/threonine-protein kinase [Planctomycetota bacterium]|nr:serine/threonine-protein kinase [Planctomycetota bacterium]